MALEPITRQEKIIAGQDLTPITRMEKFLKKFGGGGGGGEQLVIVEFDSMNHTHNVNVPELYAAAKSGKIVMCRGGFETEQNGQTIIEYFYGYLSQYLKNPNTEAAIFVSSNTSPKLIAFMIDGSVNML